MRTVLCLFCMLSTVSAQTPELNVKLVDYALSHLDQKVGHGVCWELAYQSLVANHATLGDSVCFQEARPGDIYVHGNVLALQNGYAKLEDFREEYKESTEGVYEQIARGRDSVPNVEVFGFSTGHIAILYKVLGNGQFLMLEQNVSGSRRKSRVVITQYDIDNLWFGDKKSKPILAWNRVFIRPVYGKITQDMVQYIGIEEVSWYSKHIGFPLYALWSRISNVFSKAYDPYAPQPGYLLGDFVDLSNLTNEKWSCEEPGQVAGNP